MPLALPHTVRESLARGEPISSRDILGLCDMADFLWRQIKRKRAGEYVTDESKRRYMRDYMKRWREKKRQAALHAAAATETSH
jgi:hypothetical protein